MKLQILDRLTEQQSEAWNALTANNVLASFGWLQTINESLTFDLSPHYLCAVEDNRMIGATAIYQQRHSYMAGSLDHIWLGKARRTASVLGISFLPALVCSPLQAYGCHVMTETGIGAGKRKSLTESMVREILKTADRLKLPCAFINVLDNEFELIETLSKQGFARCDELPVNYIDIIWRSFPEYLNALKKAGKRARKNAKFEINRNAREGVAIHKCSHVKGYEQEAYDLLKKNFAVHNKLCFPFDASLLCSLQTYLSKQVDFYLAFKHDRLIGIAILLKMGDIAYLPFVGVDHSRAGKDLTYFNLVYYRPIRDAISAGFKRIYYGRKMYALKAKRGCRIKNVSSWFYPSKTTSRFIVPHWFAALSAWNRRIVTRALGEKTG